MELQTLTVTFIATILLLLVVARKGLVHGIRDVNFGQIAASLGGGGDVCGNTFGETSKCEHWASLGHCKTSPWMSKKCQKTCGLCAPASDENSKFEELLLEFFDFRSREFPEFASYVGYHDYDDTLESFRLEAFDRRQNTTQRILYKVTSIDPKLLTDPNRREWHILRSYLQTFLDGYKWKEYGALNSINFLEGIAKGPQWSIVHRLESQTDFEKYLTRLAQVPTQINEQIDLMRHALATTRPSHMASLSRVPSMLESWDLNRFYFRRFEVYLANTKFRTKTKRRMINKVRSLLPSIEVALSKLKRFIEREYSLMTRAHPGVHSLTRGVEYYEACLKWYTGESTKALNVHQLGKQEVKRIKGLLEGVMRDLGFAGTLKEFFQHIAQIPKFYNHTKDTLLEGYKQLLKNVITPKLDTFFYNVTIAPITIIPVETDGPWGSYASGKFYVNLKEPRKRSTFTMLPLTLHEANPGHHYQQQYSSHWPVPRYRAQPMNGRLFSVPYHFPVYTAYAEGWAMYCEYMGHEMGLYDDPYTKFGRYVSEIFRACRLVVDTGIHAFGWSRQKAIDYLSMYSDFPLSQIVAEVDRYITAPGQACAYKIGEIRIKQMRFKAERRLGNLFDLKEFHHQVLKIGYVPLGMLEEVLDEWTDSVLALNRDMAEHLEVTGGRGSGGTNSAAPLSMVMTRGGVAGVIWSSWLVWVWSLVVVVAGMVNFNLNVVCR